MYDVEGPVHAHQHRDCQGNVMTPAPAPIQQRVTASSFVQTKMPTAPIFTPGPARQVQAAEAPSVNIPYVTDATFEQFVLKNPKPCIVLFSMLSCGSCSAMKSAVWPRLYQEHNRGFDFFEFVCTAETKTDKEHDATGHPTMLFFNKGEEIGVYLGFSQFEYYNNYIRSLRIKS